MHKIPQALLNTLGRRRLQIPTPKVAESDEAIVEPKPSAVVGTVEEVAAADAGI